MEKTSYQIIDRVKELNKNLNGIVVHIYTLDKENLTRIIDELLSVGLTPIAGTSTEHPIIAVCNYWVFQRKSTFWEGYGPDFGYGTYIETNSLDKFKEYIKVLKTTSYVKLTNPRTKLWY